MKCDNSLKYIIKLKEKIGCYRIYQKKWQGPTRYQKRRYQLATRPIKKLKNTN